MLGRKVDDPQIEWQYVSARPRWGTASSAIGVPSLLAWSWAAVETPRCDELKLSNR